jgi:hypothetical protein
MLTIHNIFLLIVYMMIIFIYIYIYIYAASSERNTTYAMRQGLDDEQEMMYVVRIYIHYI